MFVAAYSCVPRELVYYTYKTNGRYEMAAHTGEVIVSGRKNISHLISGFMQGFRPDLTPVVKNDPDEARTYLLTNRNWVVGLVGTLDRVGVYSKATYCLSPFFEQALQDPQFVLSSVAVVSMADKKCLEALHVANPSLDFVGTLTDMNTDRLKAWAYLL